MPDPITPPAEPAPTITPATAAQPSAPQQPAAPQNAATPQQPATASTAPTTGDEPLGEAGKKALQAERDARAALEKQIKQLQPLMDLLGGKGSGDTKSDLEKLTERMAELENTAATEREARLRLEVASEKGLTPQQAARLQGKTREELAADADVLLTLFPPAPGTPQAPGTPRPDPSQGAKGGAPDLDAQIRDAEAKGDLARSIALKHQKLQTITTN
jgi:hypothetical protein